MMSYLVGAIKSQQIQQAGYGICTGKVTTSIVTLYLIQRSNSQRLPLVPVRTESGMSFVTSLGIGVINHKEQVNRTFTLAYSRLISTGM
jgi:hypothetical protein